MAYHTGANEKIVYLLDFNENEKKYIWIRASSRPTMSYYTARFTVSSSNYRYLAVEKPKTSYAPRNAQLLCTHIGRFQYTIVDISIF